MNLLSFGIITWLSAFQCITFSNAQVTEGEVNCLLVMVDYMFINEEIPDDGPEWRCIDEDDNDNVYPIKGITNDFMKKNNARSGRTNLWISKARKIKGNARKRNKLIVRKKSKFRFKNKNSEGDGDRRELVQNEGTSTVLVVRVIDQVGDAPSKSSAELSDDIFGTDGDVLNLVRAEKLCFSVQIL